MSPPQRTRWCGTCILDWASRWCARVRAGPYLRSRLRNTSLNRRGFIWRERRMNRAEVIAGMQEVFDGLLLEPVVLTPQLSAKDVPEWDSLLHISIVVAIESKFDVRFRVGELETAKNVGEFADLVVRRLSDQTSRKGK